jgi:hypothetical protein
MSDLLRVWWIPQIPGDAFYVDVNDLYEAKKILTLLADYDDFQYQNKIKPDYSNTGGLEIFVNGGWEEWESDDGLNITEVNLDEID